MLKNICIMLALFLSFFICPIEGKQETKKFYCSPEQLEINQSMILVHLDCKMVEIDQLLVDQGGIYFNQEAMRCFYCRRPFNLKNTCECSMIQ
ncbi:MAG: hypothetical protein R3E91_03690 [Chlamydiales bacterium]